MWLILLWGCMSPELSDFLAARAVAICARHERCGTLEAAGYSSAADCQVTLEANDGALSNEGALGCETFDDTSVEPCLAAWDVPCDTPPDLSACDAVCR